MKRFTIILSIVTIYSSVLWSQDYPRLLEEVDLTQVQQSVPGIVPENTIVYDPVVADIINQTNLDSLVSYVRILSGEDSVWIGNNRVLIRNRGGTGGNLAASYIKQKLSSYNLEVYEQNYSSTGKNVYAVQEGYLYPEKQYIICAHYDAVDVYCADDNASGVAAVIEAARILSRYDFKYTLIYALWDEEEIGLIGSDYYASQVSSNQDQIQGVINLDMLGWDGNNDGLADVHTRNTANSNEIANRFVIVNWLYGLPLNPVIYNPGTWQSDHSSFWSRGYGAILLIEAYYGNDLNPYYHTVNDRIDKFNLPYFHNMSKLAIGSVTSFVEATNDTIIASVTPDVGYQTYLSNLEIKGVRTHFQTGAGAPHVWLSKGQETIVADSFTVISNTLLNAYFQIPESASTGLWNVNVQTQIDGKVTKEDGFTILPPPAIIVVQPDSIVVGVLPGSTKTQILTISNQGETDLNFSVIGGFSSTNYALQFDGIDDYVQVLNADVIYNQLTLEAWAVLADISIIREVIDNTAEDFQLEVWENRSIMFDAVGGGSRLVTNSNLMPLNQWVHLAATYDGSVMSIFVNGDLKAHHNYSGNINRPNAVINIGTETNSQEQFWKGIIDEVRIWTVARTQLQIQEFMYKPLIGTEPGLFAYWRFDEGTGNITFDKTSNANNGTLHGGVQWTTSSAPLMPGWFFINCDSGACAAHSSVDIELLFDATEVDTGDYYASIVINSSDPFTPSIVVPIHMIVSTMVRVDGEAELPIVFELQQNYPNPFNPVTTIKYSIPELSRVTLKVFNVLGEEVTTLISEEKNVGNYTVEFNASSLASGIYFYQL